MSIKTRALDLSSATAFSRIMEDNDGEFYDAIETITPGDLASQNRITQFYQQFLCKDNKVLDLMAADKSYLPENIPLDITGLGVKKQDLENNKRLSQGIIYDVNKCQTLPFNSNTFDMVVCTFAIEYMTSPIELFIDVARILKSGGHFCIGFSNRFYQQKAVKIWRDTELLDRPKIVLEYFKKSSQFHQYTFESSGTKTATEDMENMNNLVSPSSAFMIKGTKA
ncbi:MAG: methyltransferase domain-containing protein [Gammaproteobacteria bacterium]|nr:methyltransferase domain-containing protein [Gammaproteobacteria bacterium]